MIRLILQIVLVLGLILQLILKGRSYYLCRKAGAAYPTGLGCLSIGISMINVGALVIALAYGWIPFLITSIGGFILYYVIVVIIGQVAYKARIL